MKDALLSERSLPRTALKSALKLGRRPSHSSSSSDLSSMSSWNEAQPSMDPTRPRSLLGRRGSDKQGDVISALGSRYPPTEGSDDGIRADVMSDYRVGYTCGPDDGVVGRRKQDDAQRHILARFGDNTQPPRDNLDPLALGPSGPLDLRDASIGSAEGSSAAQNRKAEQQSTSSPLTDSSYDDDAADHGSVARRRSSHPTDSRADGGIDAGDKSPATAGDKEPYEDSSSESDSDQTPGRKKVSAAFRPRGSKKRNKCTPEQLESLEAFFAKNRNPTGRVRKELSKKLRMPERSVQVWFQNRRAKVKTLERRGVDPLTYTPPVRRKRANASKSEETKKKAAATGLKAQTGSSKGEKQQEQQSVTALPATALCIGQWRRVAPLVCFFSRRLQMLSWYINSDAVGFKLEMPWTSIKSCIFDGPTQPSYAERTEGIRHPLGHFMVELTQPPTFFMEVFRSVEPREGCDGKAQKVSWRQCADFTEGQQATQHRYHLLVGPYEQLRQAVVEFAKSNEALEKLVRFRDEERSEVSGSASDMNKVNALNEDLMHAGADLRMALASSPGYGPCSADALHESPTQSAPVPQLPQQTPPEREHHTRWTAADSASWQNYRSNLHVDASASSAWTLASGSQDPGAAMNHTYSLESYSLGTAGGYPELQDGNSRHFQTASDASAMRSLPSASTFTSPMLSGGGVADDPHSSSVYPGPHWSSSGGDEVRKTATTGHRWYPSYSHHEQLISGDSISHPATAGEAALSRSYSERAYSQPMGDAYSRHYAHHDSSQAHNEAANADHRKY